MIQPHGASCVSLQSSQLSIRCSSSSLIIQGEQIQYKPQTTNRNYLILTHFSASSQLRQLSPIIMLKTKRVKQLDRRVYNNTFLYEIIRSLQICSLSDSVFIVQRVPKQIGYFVTIINRLSYNRKQQLIMFDQFWIEFYQALYLLVNKTNSNNNNINSNSSNINANGNVHGNGNVNDQYIKYIKQLKQSLTKLTKSYERIFMLMDSLVLQNQALRNSINNMLQQVIIKQMDKDEFFNQHILGQQITQNKDYVNWNDNHNNHNNHNKDEQNNLINNSLTSLQTQQQHQLLQQQQQQIRSNFLINTINIIKSCLKIKLKKQYIITKIFTRQFYQILKNNFMVFFESQKQLLLTVLTYCSVYHYCQMWKIVFEEGRTRKCQNLKLFQILLTNGMINYARDIYNKKNRAICTKSKKYNKGKHNINNNISNTIDQQQQVIPQNSQLFNEPQFLSWQNCLTIIQQCFLHLSAERKLFIDNILQLMLRCNLERQQFQYLLKYVQSSVENKIYDQKNSNSFRKIMMKMEMYIMGKMNGRRAKGEKSHEKNKEQFIVIDMEGQNNKINTIIYNNLINNSHTSSPINKHTIITLMKIYKLLLVHQTRYKLLITRQPINCLLRLAINKKGIIYGLRCELQSLFNQYENTLTLEIEISKSKCVDQP